MLKIQFKLGQSRIYFSVYTHWLQMIGSQSRIIIRNLRDYGTSPTTSHSHEPRTTLGFKLGSFRRPAIALPLVLKPWTNFVPFLFPENQFSASGFFPLKAKVIVSSSFSMMAFLMKDAHQRKKRRMARYWVASPKKILPL